MKALKISATIIGLLVLLVVLVGIYRFNFTNDDIYVETAIGETVKYDEYVKNKDYYDGVENSMAPFALLKSSEITAPDSEDLVQLTNGTGSYETVPGAASRGVVTVLDDTTALWGDEGGRTDLSVILTSNQGGSGTFYYLVLFNVSGNVFTKKAEVFLGDRIKVTDIGIGELVHDPEADYRITVQILVREENDSMASEPTTQTTKTFYVTNQELEEVEVGLDDT